MIGDDNYTIETAVVASEKKREREFWINKLSGELMKSIFPYDHHDRKTKTSIIRKDRICFDEVLVNMLIKVSKNSENKIFIILVAGLVALLRKYSGSNDIIIGVPVLKQDREVKFTNTVLTLRNQFSDEITFKELLFLIRQTIIEATENQNYPLSSLIHNLGWEMSTTDFPLFDSALLLNNIHDKKYIQHLNLNLIFSFTKTEDTITGEIEYNSALYENSTINQITKHFIHLLTEALTNVDVSINELDIVAAAEKELLVNGFNDHSKKLIRYPVNSSIVELFEQQVENCPDDIAVVYEKNRIKYDELNKKANQLARILRNKGVNIDTHVGIVVERSIDLIVGILGILKAGAAYLSLDPENPVSRNHFMLEDGAVEVLLTQKFIIESNKEIWSVVPTENVISLDDPSIYSGDNSNLNIHIKPQDLAYILYTSGTTGEPKGVMVEHRNVVNLVNGLYDKIYKNYNHSLNICMVSPYIFDASVKQIFCALLLGHTLHIVPQDTRINGSSLLDYYQQNSIDISDGTPAHLRLLLESAPADNLRRSIKQFVIGGETLSLELVKGILEHFDAKITNVYGPTECCVDSTAFDITKDNIELLESIPIGKSLYKQYVYILDSKNQLQPIGVAGELCISGANVARGYWNRKLLTVEKFTDDPFASDRRMYRTGDLARWLPDGNIEYLGRLDQQVKVGGFRIELGEIETELIRHKKITAAVAAVREDRDGDKYLCAYVIADEKLDSSLLREYLSQKVPNYSLPLYFIQIDKIPLTPNGKIDRNALPMPEIGVADKYVAPRNGTEEKLVDIWSEVLRLDKEIIGIEDNFFELGGHSLKATIQISKIHKELNVKVPLEQVFISPTIKELARYIENTNMDNFKSIESAEKKEFYDLSSIQKRLYILQQMTPDSVSYNMPGILELEGHVSRDRLEQTFKTLIDRHESFRTSFEMINDNPVQKIHDEVDFRIEYFEAAEGEIEKIIKKFMRPFDLKKPPLLKAGLIKISGTKYILMVDMHHIISDGTSLSIFIRDFMAVYGNQKLTPLRIHYKDFCEWQKRERVTGILSKQEEYWLTQFKGNIPTLNLPIDFPRRSVQSFAGNKIRFKLSKEESEVLNKYALEADVTLFMLLIAIYNIFLAKITGQEDIVVGTGIAGRRHVDLHQIVGMFVNTLALRNFPSADKTFSQFLKEVKKSTLGAFDNQDYQFEDLVDKVVIQRDWSRNPLVDAVFVLQNMREESGNIKEIEVPDLKLTPYQYENYTSKFDLSLYGEEIEGRLCFTFEYCSELFKQETIESFINGFKEIVRFIIRDKNAQLSDITISYGLLTAESSGLNYDFSF